MYHRVFAILAAILVPFSDSPIGAGTLPTRPKAEDQASSPSYRWEAKLPSKPGIMLRYEAALTYAEITTSQRDGNAQTEWGRIRNLARVRIIVE